MFITMRNDLLVQILLKTNGTPFWIQKENVIILSLFELHETNILVVSFVVNDAQAYSNS